MKALSDLHIGMRNFKTALAIFLCLILYRFIPGEASFACIAALIAMQSTLGESLEQGRNRLMGTAIGGIFGALFVFGGIGSVHPWVQPFIIAAGISVLIAFCNFAGKRGAIVMGCVTYLAIILSGVQEHIWLFSLWRVVDNTVGILVAVGVNLAIRPPAEPPAGLPDAVQQASSDGQPSEIPSAEQDKPSAGEAP